MKKNAVVGSIQLAMLLCVCIVMPLVLLFSTIGWIAQSGASIVSSGAAYGVARQSTHQVTIQQNGETERMGIWSYTMIELAKIQQDTTLQTSGINRSFDALQMAVSCLFALVVCAIILYGLYAVMTSRYEGN